MLQEAKKPSPDMRELLLGGSGEWWLFSCAAVTTPKSPCLPSSFRKPSSPVYLLSCSSHFNLFCLPFPSHSGLVKPFTFALANALRQPYFGCVTLLNSAMPLLSALPMPRAGRQACAGQLSLHYYQRSLSEEALSGVRPGAFPSSFLALASWDLTCCEFCE